MSGLGFIGILGFYTISKLEINLKHFLSPISAYNVYQKYRNVYIDNRPIKIGITEDEIRIKATQLRNIVTAPTPSYHKRTFRSIENHREFT